MSVCFSFKGQALDQEGRLPDGGRPYFTIPSKGVVRDRLIEPAAWALNAAKMDSVLAGEALTDPGLRVRLVALEILTFAQTLEVLRALAAGSSGPNKVMGSLARPSPEIRFDFHKEGQTSSVWCASVSPSRGGPVRKFCVNVARDKLGGDDLAASSATMREIAAIDPDIALAEMLALTSVDPQGWAGRPVTVAINRWIEDAREVHSVRSPSGGTTLVLLDDFGLGERGSGHVVASCRALDPLAQSRLAGDIAHFVSFCRRRVAEGKLAALPQIDINDGDVVIASGRPVIVALRGLAAATDRGQ